MGYTHYWYRVKTLPLKRWQAFMGDFQKLFITLPTQTTSAGGYYKDQRLQIGGWDGTGKPEIKANVIRFNGTPEELSHETFVLQRTFAPQDWERPKPDEKGIDMWFAFCKTARKPYDLLVVATLFAAKYHFGEDFTFSSDGDADELQGGYDYWLQVCKPNNPKPLTEMVRD